MSQSSISSRLDLRTVRNAQHAARNGTAGFYVRNTLTKIIVRGPFGNPAEADRVARSYSYWERVE